MSQAKVFGPLESDPLGIPLINIDQLLGIFHQTQRPKEQFLLGIEYEIFGHDRLKNQPLAYEGDVSITSLFNHLAHKSLKSSDPFELVVEDGSVVALNCKRAIIALEPGGQIEIAAKPYKTVEEVVKVLHDLCGQISKAAADLGIDLFAMGIHPLAERADMAKVKKKRYDIMRKYMGSLSGLGLDMMNRSCAIQVNLDYHSEQDMVQKMRLAASLVPFYSLLSANSPFLAGQPSSCFGYRSYVWQKTDPQRTGIPSVIFDKDFGYMKWIDFVLDIPMYFIRRDQAYLDVAGASFREFMKNGLIGHKATLRDFMDHLTTAFTEVRLKPIIELRSTDSMPLVYLNAFVAMTWAHFYHEPTHQKVAALFDNLSHAELIDLHSQTINLGPRALFRGQKIFDILDELLNMPKNLEHELKDYLDPLKSLVQKNTTCTEWAQNNFANINKKNIGTLIKNLNPLGQPLI